MPFLPLDRVLQQAIAHHRAGRVEQAERQYRIVLRQQPGQPDANHNLGLLLLQRGRAEEALPFLKRVTGLAPQVEPHWLRYIDALIAADRQGEAHLAIAQAQGHGVNSALLEQRAIRAGQPSTARLKLLFGIYQRGDALTAEIAARFFIDEFPAHPLGWQVLGAILHDGGKLAEALEIRKQTAAAFPDDANTHNNLAHTLLALHQYGDALVSARRALELNPGLAEARLHEAKALAAISLSAIGKPSTE